MAQIHAGRLSEAIGTMKYTRSFRKTCIRMEIIASKGWNSISSQRCSAESGHEFYESSPGFGNTDGHLHY
jgi:hypothetical protein